MRIGYTCAYAPLPLLHAAGADPCRILPLSRAEDHSGRLLHENMCPHVRRVLDRAMEPDLPELRAMVFVNSCDAMRRLADAWASVRPADATFLMDLPVVADERSIAHLARELGRLRRILETWTSATITDEAIERSIATYNELFDLLSTFRSRLAAGSLPASRMQAIHGEVGTRSPGEAVATLRALEQEPASGARGVPVLLAGNVLPDPEALDLMERCGARIVDEDTCTGSRQISHVTLDGQTPLEALARALLTRPACARTMAPNDPGRLASDIARRARGAGARGVILHTLKFCDSYLARVPAIREALVREDLPFLVLEGDCTLRSLGQHRTRIEAFTEMLS
jgi:benzoyl-CoA reductase/2-hydroxyglutaryl-CoA dehydratase subunit BcrC/BadD/HgdB